MTRIDSDLHKPTTEFRDFLESEVVREFRRNRTFRRLRAAAVIVVSVGIGMSATLASAQVRENAQKDSILQAANAEASIAAWRYGLAKAQLADQQKRLAAGAIASSELAEAEAQVAASEYEVARTILNIREIQASGLPARDDLNAPLVRGEDFVKERLEAQAMLADRKLRAAEAKREDAARRVSVGAAQESQLSEAELELLTARANLVVLSTRMKARQDFLQKSTPVQELTRQIERSELQQRLVVAQQALRNAQAALALAQRQRDAGVIMEVDLLRARLAVAERELDLRQLADRLQKLRD